MKELFTSFRWQDGLDILVLSVVIYWGLNLIRGTRAVPMLIGLGMVYAIYFLSNVFEVYTLNVLLRNLLGWSLVLVFIVFQDDIRRALTQVGTRPLFSPRERVAQGQAVEELIKALTYLASRRVGALVVLQNEVGLNQYIEVGVPLDAQVSKELVTSIFLPGSPIHDGALIIQHGRITAAGCFLPLTTNPNVSKTLGTRHRAAIGLTEETDAAAIVVSEEDGMISLVRQGKITRDVDAATLRTTLHRLLLA
ncbi:MAG: TIGR00159 family protein [Deltaproteobacteria bacterium]|nr:MAG: TIGR00159 family protein [Deltaproteobacteria bacterium]TMA68576.1 MAG: TIGR00159 family protein [Deltaproteobacteria bacterium]TMB41935.1 MAG: TIGR00159 family protein [Deltaproteobacteria bacterium]